MEGLSSLYASSDSSNEDNVENNEGFLETAAKPSETVEDVERTPNNTSSMPDKLSQKEQHHGEMTIGTTNGCKDQQVHNPQQQLDHKNHSRKKARRGIVKFITLQESNTSKNNDNKRALFVRSQPHVPGNWAGHVFVKLSPHPASSLATWQEAEKKGLDRIRKRLESSGYSGSCAVVVHQQMNWHVSLSRPFYLQAAFIDSFVKELEQSLMAPRQQQSRTTAVVASSSSNSRTIRILPHECTLLVNDEKTRSFWVWPVQPSLEDLVQIVDRILLLYKQPTYYRPAHFHISVASIPEDLSIFWNNSNCINTMGNESTDDDDEEDESLHARITEVHCVIGNKSFSFPLKV